MIRSGSRGTLLTWRLSNIAHGSVGWFKCDGYRLPAGVGGAEEECTWLAQDPGVPPSKLEDIVKKLAGIAEQVRPLPDASELVGAQLRSRAGC